MDLPLNPPDEVIESLLSKTTVSDELESVTSAAESDRSSQSAEERIKKWIEKKELFISLEREEDAKQTEQALAVLPIKDLISKGLALKGLIVEDTRTGLWGRQIMTLTRADAKQDSSELPPHRFSPGDIVAVRSKFGQTSLEKEQDSVRGIVYKVSNEQIQIALSSKPLSLLTASKSSMTTQKQQETKDNEFLNMDYNGRIVTLVQVGNDTTFKRMEIALKRLASLQAEHRITGALQVLFGIEKPSPVQITKYLPLETRYTSAFMNNSQLEAISGALASTQLFLIHGPPGTGKTTVLIEYILQAVKQFGQRILVCAPSNVAVDNIVERLAPFARGSNSRTSANSTTGAFKMVRIGHPARVQSAALQFTLEEQYRQSNGYEVVKSLQEDMDKKAKEISKAQSYAHKRALQREWFDLKKDLKRVSVTSMKQVVSDANVVLATCTGADDKMLRGLTSGFDVVVVDEAAQALDPIILIPLLAAKKIVLAGDHLQLPPTIKSTKAIQQDLCTQTFFERAIKRCSSVSRLLTVQYRMHDMIMKYSSTSLYHSKLVSGEDVKSHTLEDLVSEANVKSAPKNIKSSSSSVARQDDQTSQWKDDYLKNPLILVDTAGCSLEESGAENESKSNEGEANVVVELVKKLVTAGIEAKDIGIISPYNAQVDLIRTKLYPIVGKKEIEISSVDSFQGREKECIIYTLVRSNRHHNVGFLSSDQRTNVAITRAKRLLIIVTDTETTGSHKFLRKLFNFCEQHGQYWSAAEFVQTYEAAEHLPQYGATKSGKKLNKPKPVQSPTAPSNPNNQPTTSQASLNSTDSKNKVKDSPQATLNASSSLGAQLDVEPKDQIVVPSTLDDAQLRKTGDSTQLDTKGDQDTTSSLAGEVELTQLAERNEVETHDHSTTLHTLSNPFDILPDAKGPEKSEFEHSPQSSKSSKSIDSRPTETVSKPPQDYREMQKAKYEAQKKAAQSPTVPALGASSSSSPYAATPKYGTSSNESRFGITSSYIPKPSMHAPKSSGARKPSENASPSSSSNSGKAPPVAVKASLMKLDDDAFLDGLIKESETCYAKGCKASTHLFSETCKFCKHVYCLKHMGAESHGCGEHAKREGMAAAKKKSADLRIKAASPPVIDSSSKLKDWQRSSLHDKLAKKVEAKKEQRSKKPAAKK